jgi:hypothetical protein
VSAGGHMKILWSTVLVLLSSLGALFIYQNSNRTLSVDASGYQLTFDLGFWGLGATSLHFALFVLAIFVVGVAFGTTLPFFFKVFSKK